MCVYVYVCVFVNVNALVKTLATYLVQGVGNDENMVSQITLMCYLQNFTTILNQLHRWFLCISIHIYRYMCVYVFARLSTKR